LVDITKTRNTRSAGSFQTVCSDLIEAMVEVAGLLEPGRFGSDGSGAT
jgi:hypothetical protein